MIKKTLLRCRPEESTALPWPLERGIPTITLNMPTERDSWPALQPGVFDSSGGFRGHRVVVDFDIVEATAALLSLQFCAERGPCPDLEITLDGTHRGLYHPHVTRETRSQTGEPGPIAGHVDLRIGFPAEWLTPGRHILTMTTALDRAAALGGGRWGATHDVTYEPGERLPEARGHYGPWFGSYIRWSEVELSAVETIATDATVQLRPTPFFVHQDGVEVELVDIDVTWVAGTQPPDPIVIDWPQSQSRVDPAATGRDFGMLRSRVAVAHFAAATAVTVHVGAETHREQITPSRRWTVHLIPHVHLDLGFTDSQGKVLELHCRNIDRAIDRFAIDPDFRFCVDGSIVVAEYMQTRPPARVKQMHDAIEAGRLGVNTFHSNFLTGVLSLEEMYRSADLALTLPRSTSSGLRYANLTDVPTYSRSIPSVLADLGIDGFVGMANHGRAATETSDQLHLLSPVRWHGPDGQEVLAHFADHYSQLRFIAADPQAVAGASNGLDRYLARYERPDYLPEDLAVIGTHADNEDLADGDTDFVKRWNDSFAWPRFRVSTFDEYLAAVEPLTAELPVWRSETGTYWEDGVGSAAADFALYRRAQSLLPATETLGALVSAGAGNVRTNRRELDRAWSDLSIGAEHTLTWAHSMAHPHAPPVADQLDWKTRYIKDAYRVATDEMRRHLAQLSELADLSGPGYLAFNPHAWTADLDAEVELLESVEILGPDGTLPVEVLSNCAGLRRVRMHLAAMAPHSWRFLPTTSARLTAPGGEAASHSASADLNTEAGFVHSSVGEPIVSRGWEVVLDPATQLPRTMRHLPSGRELVDASATVQLGQLVRAAQIPFDAEASEQLAQPPDIHDHHRARTLPIENFRNTANPQPSDLVTESPTMEYVGCRRTHDGMRLRWRGSGAGLKTVRVEVLLRDDRGVCDLDVSFVKAPCLDMEAVYICFPFAGTAPIVRYDRPLGWVCPSTDHGPGASNEWAAATHTVSLESPEGEIRWAPLDAPLFTIGDLVRGRWPATFSPECAHLYSYVMNNFWPCNTPPWQPGPVSFRFRFEATQQFDPAASARFGRTAALNAQTCEILPLDRFDRTGSGVYQEGNLGLAIPNDDVDIQVRQASDPAAFAVHLTNLQDHGVTVSATLPQCLTVPNGAEAAGHEIGMAIAPFGVSHTHVTSA